MTGFNRLKISNTKKRILRWAGRRVFTVRELMMFLGSKNTNVRHHVDQLAGWGLLEVCGRRGNATLYRAGGRS